MGPTTSLASCIESGPSEAPGGVVLYLNGIISGLVAGGAYSLVAISITLIYRTTGVLSFAHAGFALVAAFLYGELLGPLPKLAAAFVALALTVVYGLAVERVALRPVRNSSGTIRLIATLGVLSFSSGLMLVAFGADPSHKPLLLTPDRSVRIGSLSVGYQQLLIFVLAAAGAIALGWFLKKTRLGLAVRAVASNNEAARLMGTSTVHVAQFNWAVGAALAGITGILVAPNAVSISGGLTVTFPLLLVRALTASLVGGLASLPLTFLGGLMVGVVQSLTLLKSSQPGSQELATLGLVVIVLLVRKSWAPDPRVEPAIPVGPRFVLPRAVTDARARASTWLHRAGPVAYAVGAVVAAWALLVPTRSEYWGFVGARALFYAIEALGLVVLAGWAGQASLMQGAYVGMGAFLTGLLTQTHGMPLELAIPLAALGGVVLGALVGIPALRLTGLQFAIASLAFSGAASEWLFRRPGFTESMPRGRMFGIDIFPTNHLYAVMLPVTGALFLAVWALRRSTFWPLLLASRDGPETVSHFGADPSRVRMAAFMFAAFIAAIGGAFWGVLLTRFSPFEFSFGLSIALLLYTVIGGSESLAGPVIAAVLFGVVPQLLQTRSGAEASAWPDLIAGVVVVVLVASNPRGLAEVVVRRRHVVTAARTERAVRFRRFEPLVSAAREARPALATPAELEAT